MVLNAVGNGAGVSAGTDLEGGGDTVGIQDFMQLARVGSQTVLVANIHRDSPIQPANANVLVDKRQACVCSRLAPRCRFATRAATPVSWITIAIRASSRRGVNRRPSMRIRVTSRGKCRWGITTSSHHKG